MDTNLSIRIKHASPLTHSSAVIHASGRCLSLRIIGCVRLIDIKPDLPYVQS